MKRKVTTVLSSILMLYGLLLVVGCSGGGGGGGGGGGNSGGGSTDVASLEVGEKVSVVDPTTTASKVKSLKIGYQQLSLDQLPANSDYNTDESHVYVEERSAESMSIINEILCMFAQSGYDEMVNEGNYKAQIDLGQCEGSNDDASSAGSSSQNQSSGSNATEYEFWTVNSSRESDTSPHIVKVWINQEGEEDEYHSEPATTIHVELTITESVSDTNPYGLFTLYFQGITVEGSQEMMHGFLKAEEDEDGKILLKFYCDGGMTFGEEEYTFTEKVTLDRAADGSSGAGSVYNAESEPGHGTESESFNIAYNDSYFYRTDGSTNTCLSRDNPHTSVWRYGLYHDENHATPGTRLTVSSGFPLKIGNDHGWAGYYGIWFPNDIDIESGDTVYKMEYNDGESTSTEYTIFIAGGKLQKHTKKTLTLSEIVGIPLDWSSCDENSCTQARVEWDSTEQEFYKTATLDQSSDNYLWNTLESPELVQFDSNDWDFHFWSQALGGSGRVNLRDPETGDLATLTNSSTVVFHVQDTVYPGDEGIPTSLACFENCPDPSELDFASDTDDGYFDKSSWSSNDSFNNTNMNTAPANLVAGTNYIAYTFDSSDMLLKYDGSAAVMTGESDSNQWGIWTGAMFPPTEANFALLACDWDETDSSTCQWQAWEKLDVFYTWETGHENWNQLTALQDGNNEFVSFDPPLSVEYTHTTGSKFFLEYNGFGDLWGIPGKCVDMDTGEDTDCWNDGDDDKYIRWVPEFSIADGTLVTNALDSSLGYYVKALDKEERMRSVDTSECVDSGLSFTDYTLPDEDDYQDPNIGDQPTVDGAPAVIGGILQ